MCLENHDRIFAGPYEVSYRLQCLKVRYFSVNKDKNEGVDAGSDSMTAIRVCELL